MRKTHVAPGPLLKPPKTCEGQECTDLRAEHWYSRFSKGEVSDRTLAAAITFFATVALRPLRPMGRITLPSLMCPRCHHTSPPECFCRTCGHYRAPIEGSTS